MYIIEATDLWITEDINQSLFYHEQETGKN